MEVRDAQKIIMMHLKYDCIGDVIEATEIAASTAYRWQTRIVERPDLVTFIKLCAYYNIDVSIHEIRNSIKKGLTHV